MERFWLTLLFGIFFSYLSISAKITPRGVPLSRAALYDPQKDFVCLDGSRLISFSFVNDDYCDCPDGSDEPGTAACSNGKFFCVNAGHTSTFIQSSRVNDGICDCCDGSDEFDGISCPDKCYELGQLAREEAERSIRLSKDGFTKRLEMSTNGKNNRDKKEEERKQLESQRQNVENIRNEKLKIKESVELPEKEALEAHQKFEDERKSREDEEEKNSIEKEALDMFNLIDGDSDGVITVVEIQSRAIFDRNKDGVVSDEEASFFLNLEQEMTKEEFLKTGWILAKPYFLMEKGMFIPPTSSQENHNKEQEEEVPLLPQENDFEDDERDDLRPLPDDGEKNDEEEELNDYDDTQDHEQKDGGDNNEVEIDKPKYDEATMELIQAADKARKEFEEADSDLRDVTKKLEELNDVLNLDFGDDERFSPLHGLCFDYEDREYVYTLCPFKDANQRGKNGGGTVNLGRWGHWSGDEENKYSQMLYDKGQSCWNGPARSARIFINCGIDSRVISVSEPSRCEYKFEFISPAACINPELLNNTHSHDEL